MLGHVDHGKTTLLDYIRKTAVAKKEAGGITQKVSAYEIEHKTPDGKTARITFLDTPGHEAFAGIRARGAAAADIAILVVSAEDGVKPQTLEAARFLRESKTPFVVALTKTDKPNADIERAKQNLLENEIYIEGYGGSIPCVPLSGRTGEGVPELLEMILLVAEIENISGHPEKPAEGFVLETAKTKEHGVAATLIVKDGSLKKGMFLGVNGIVFLPRALENFLGERIEAAAPGSPVRVMGWERAPEVGSLFRAFSDKKSAEAYRDGFQENTPAHARTKKSDRAENPKDARVAVALVVKADSAGTLEAIRHELKKLETEKVFPKIIRSGEGDVNESDIKMTLAREDGIVLGFNVKADASAKRLAERESVALEIFSVIYKLSERVKEILTEKTPKTEVSETKGTAKILKVFSVVKDREILGGKVTDGVLNTGDEIKIIRRGAEIGKAKIRELEQQKVKTSEVAKDREFGALVETKIEIAAGDLLEAFVVVRK